MVEGDEVVITGQKVWTSGAARANRMFLLCRTDPDADKHAGLSYVLIDFTGPGVAYRPIKQMSGAAEFCEDFLDGVRSPLFNVIGGLNNGWRVAMTTLGHERGGRATVAHLGFEREFWELVETARKRGKTADPLVRQRLAWAYTQVELMRYSGLRTLAQLAAGRPPGPEASVAKLFWSEYHKRLGEIAIGIEGADGLLRPDGDGYPVSSWQSVFLSSRAGTIYSGTSEIQRNIIGERALGLPKEPRVCGASGLEALSPDGHARSGIRNGRPERSMLMGVSAEQQELRASVRRFLADRAPLRRVRELMETEDGTDPGVWEQAGAQLGLQGLAIPAGYGGAGFTFAEQAIVLEEFGAALYGGPYLASAVLAATALLASPDEGARRELLPRSRPARPSRRWPSPRTTGPGIRARSGCPPSRTARTGGWTGTRASCSTAGPPG